ncbi:sulfatase [Gimesia benthica]|uniref:Sulfatase n=1 Tax=Gimesia benthica TaxID=2608982 RepID=A0A6I6AAI4_9PLAN|nr:sulfatase [Gimesia benthica]QGQ22051.1 sulfatase [Gimesia benthica]
MRELLLSCIFVSVTLTKRIGHAWNRTTVAESQKKPKAGSALYSNSSPQQMFFEKDLETMFRLCFQVVMIVVTSLLTAGDVIGQIRRPNILLAISDDQSWIHAGAYGNKNVKTPAFDRVAREGVLFTHAFCSAPSCTPSRAALLTGQDFWRLEQGANLMGTLPKKFPVYPDLLETAGYQIGYTGKGWAPGDVRAGGRTRNPAGPLFNHRQVGYVTAFGEFLKSKPKDKPFCFWFGSSDPHRPYVKGSGKQSGKNLADISVPDFLPDTPEVRSDIADYLFEIERFDRDLGLMLEMLKKEGQLENTLVVVTSDNGMPFPRAKTSLYDHGTRMPLAVRWPSKIPAGRIVVDFVNLTDLAPTFLEAAGVDIPSEMTGHSLLSMLTSKKSGDVELLRDKVVFGRERHGWNRDPNIGYPCRAIRTREYLYIRNFKPDRFPGYDIDGGPTLDYLMQHASENSVKPLHRLWFQLRPGEELYDLRQDPYQMQNLYSNPEYTKTREELRTGLETILRQGGDPRIVGNGDVFDTYRYFSRPTGNWGKLRTLEAVK